jgi:hypothetical protein
VDKITVKQAYNKGWASQGTNADWDDAAVRFDRKYAPDALRSPLSHELSVAWMDAWSDRQAGRRKGHALRCPKGLTLNTNHTGHDDCEDWT